jgi:hypothetical protein
MSQNLTLSQVTKKNKNDFWNYAVGLSSGVVSGFVSIIIAFAINNYFLSLPPYTAQIFQIQFPYSLYQFLFYLRFQLLFVIIPCTVLGIVYALSYKKLPTHNDLVKSLVLGIVYFLPLSLWAGSWSIPSPIQLTLLVPFYLLFSVLLALTYPRFKRL